MIYELHKRRQWRRNLNIYSSSNYTGGKKRKKKKKLKRAKCCRERERKYSVGAYRLTLTKSPLKVWERRSSVLVNGAIKRQIKMRHARERIDSCRRHRHHHRHSTAVAHTHTLYVYNADKLFSKKILHFHFSLSLSFGFLIRIVARKFIHLQIHKKIQKLSIGSWLEPTDPDSKRLMGASWSWRTSRRMCIVLYSMRTRRRLRIHLLLLLSLLLLRRLKEIKPDASKDESIEAKGNGTRGRKEEKIYLYTCKEGDGRERENKCNAISSFRVTPIELLLSSIYREPTSRAPCGIYLYFICISFSLSLSSFSFLIFFLLLSFRTVCSCCNKYRSIFLLFLPSSFIQCYTLLSSLDLISAKDGPLRDPICARHVGEHATSSSGTGGGRHFAVAMPEKKIYSSHGVILKGREAE